MASLSPGAVLSGAAHERVATRRQRRQLEAAIRSRHEHAAAADPRARRAIHHGDHDVPHRRAARSKRHAGHAERAQRTDQDVGTGALFSHRQRDQLRAIGIWNARQVST
jgi:hypothetical protein